MPDPVPQTSVRHRQPVHGDRPLSADTLRPGLHVRDGSNLQTQRQHGGPARLRREAVHGRTCMRGGSGVQPNGRNGRRSRLRSEAVLSRLCVPLGVAVRIECLFRRARLRADSVLQRAVRRQRDLRLNATRARVRRTQVHARRRVRLRGVRRRDLPAEPMDLFEPASLVRTPVDCDSAGGTGDFARDDCDSAGEFAIRLAGPVPQCRDGRDSVRRSQSLRSRRS